jgi:transcriptional regulator with XRE-family HTH domain
VTQIATPSPLPTATRRDDVGTLLRDWRRRRRMSQLELALSAEVSARHLSFVETGRARPSRELLLHLAEHLDIPLRQRNELLLAAGLAPVFGETDLEAPAMQPVRDAIRRLLTAHEPFPAVVVDGRWNLIDSNRAVAVMLAGVEPTMLTPPVNVVRISLHPDGMARRIANFTEFREHMLTRLRRQVSLSGDPGLKELFDEVSAYPHPTGEPHVTGISRSPELVVPLRLRTDVGELAFISTVATFGTPADITPDELVIEAFFPADAATAETLLGSAGARPAEV